MLNVFKKRNGLHSSDGGLTWTVVDGLAITEDLWGVAFAPAGRGALIGDKGTFLSTEDGGQSWMQQAIGTNENLRDVLFTLGQILVVTDQGTLLWDSSDDSGSWEQQQTQALNAFYAMSLVNNQLQIVGWDGRLFTYPWQAPERLFLPMVTK